MLFAHLPTPALALYGGQAVRRADWISIACCAFCWCFQSENMLKD
jgi:hypothetical protein